MHIIVLIAQLVWKSVYLYGAYDTYILHTYVHSGMYADDIARRTK